MNRNNFLKVKKKQKQKNERASVSGFDLRDVSWIVGTVETVGEGIVGTVDTVEIVETIDRVREQ